MAQRKLPAYPLFVKDPNFSLWSFTDELNEGNVKSWFGEEKPVYGFLKTKNGTYCFLGNAEDFASCGIKKAKQTSLSVTAFTTEYGFEADGISLSVRFVSPLTLNDLNLLSLPVCYMEYELSGEGEVSVFVNRKIAYNASTADKSVRGGSFQRDGYECAVVGLKKQCPLSSQGDRIGADWGYWYLSGERSVWLSEVELAAYLAGGLCPSPSQGAGGYLASFNTRKSGSIMLGYDDIVSVDYFGHFLKGYYLNSHTIFEALDEIEKNRLGIDGRLAAFDEKMKGRAGAYGDGYYRVLCASLRQSIAAHKLAEYNGELLFFSKECGSCGCIATTDVSYPSMPLYLLYNAELVKGMMRPILKFAQMPVWNYGFAPHDVGIYPACCGQIYGLNPKFQPNLFKTEAEKEYSYYPYYLLPPSEETYLFSSQMPVEESADLLIMFYACYLRDHDISFFSEHSVLCGRWVEYLVKYGLKPENQLCTDDFAGHLKNNLNLAIKATVGIASYAELLKASKVQAWRKYRSIAETYAAQIIAFGDKYTHLPLTWDSGEDTFSLKYNLAFDKLLRLGLFPQSLCEREIDYYLKRNSRYGIPLDSRKQYTKSDWLCWAATITEDQEKSRRMLAPLADYLQNAAYREPFCDWFDTEGDGQPHGGFCARSVQGGCFILLLKEAMKE